MWSVRSRECGQIKWRFLAAVPRITVAISHILLRARTRLKTGAYGIIEQPRPGRAEFFALPNSSIESNAEKN
jgi:hypothetical protein